MNTREASRLPTLTDFIGTYKESRQSAGIKQRRNSYERIYS